MNTSSVPAKINLRNLLLFSLTISVVLIAMVFLTSCATSNTSANHNIGTATSNTENTDTVEGESTTEEYFDSTSKSASIWVDKANMTWQGDYRCDTVAVPPNSAVDYPDETFAVVSYQDYVNIITTSQQKLNSSHLNCADYSDPTSNYIVIVEPLRGAVRADMQLHDLVIEDGEIILYAGTHSYGNTANGYTCILVVPTQMPVGTPLEYRNVMSEEELSQQSPINDASSSSDSSNLSSKGTIGWAPDQILAKPIIYLYPETEQEVHVSLSDPEAITCSYPAYHDGWHVIASPDGSLEDTDSDRDLYALYYEADTNKQLNFEDGFVVRGCDSATFLEEKLATLGLTDRESEEFIVYWLPRLEANEYNFIHFLTEDEIDEQMELNIAPSPDTTIRVCMAFKGLDEPINIEEQKLATPEREGFVAVEWGGIAL